MLKATLLTSLFLAAAGVVAAPSTQAFPPPSDHTPITTSPGLLTGGSPAASSAIFAFADAGDQSTLNLFMPAFGGNPIFTNNDGDPIGLTKPLGVLSGGVQFGLNNLTTNTNFLANMPDVDGNFHAFYTGSCNSAASCNTEFQVFAVGNLAAAVDTSINNLLTTDPTTAFVMVGWEDLTADQGSDWDYNDLIFLFSNLISSPPPPGVPEPASLALLGSALIALGAARARRSRKVT